MKILVTGSSGFIGYHLCKRLTDCGHTVVGVDDHNDYYDVNLKKARNNNLKNKNFRFINEDINSLKIDGLSFDILINLAAQAGVRVNPDREYLYHHTNTKGFKNLCDLCLENKINKVIYASSSSVYSAKKDMKFKEDQTDIEPLSSYGKSKAKNEEYASIFSKKNNMEFIGLRFFSVYGPYGRPDMAYYKFTESIKKYKTVILNNNGNMRRDMTYIDDIIDGIVKAIDYIFIEDLKGKNEIFNLGNDMPIKTKYLLDFLQNKLKIKARITNKETINEVNFTHANIEKSKKLLGYNPKTNFSAGMMKFLDWYKKYEKE